MTLPSEPVRFYHRGRVVAVDGVPPTRTVLDWLREDAGCRGTKEGCNEGDCGACTVAVGEPDAAGGLAWRNVNACMQFVPMLHGRALVTVEDLAPLNGGAPHPAQQAMVDCHGSQCGFCTPGFVMSLWTLSQRGGRPDRAAVADALAGNLCRCTGYRPILDAAERMAAMPAAPLDTAPIAQALQGLRGADRRHGDFHAPASIETLAALREQLPQATLLAGATDVAVWVNKQFRPVGALIHAGGVEALRRIEMDGDRLVIGAAASLEDAWAAMAARAPALAEVALRFASPPIRHAGTMGGNVANGSPIGDAAPVLMALDAQLLLRRGAAQRRLPLDTFYVDYMKNRLESGEFLQAIEVPLAAFARTVRADKVSKRYDSDISAVATGFAIALDGDGRVREVRLAFGGMAAVVKRAAAAEAALVGRAWDEAALADAQAALAQDFAPLTDLRASAAYRLRVAQNLLRRFWLETRAHDPLPPEATRVWPRRVVEAGA